MLDEDSWLGIGAEYEEAVRLQGRQAKTMQELHSFELVARRLASLGAPRLNLLQTGCSCLHQRPLILSPS